MTEEEEARERFWSHLANFCNDEEDVFLSHEIPKDSGEKANTLLAAAGKCYEMDGKRASFSFAVGAAITLFESIGASRKQLKPLFHLRQALQDLDCGLSDPALVIKGSASQPTSTWDAKACLVLALDGRIRLGEPLDAAAREVCDAYVRAAGRRGGPAKEGQTTLKNWREEFQRGRARHGMALYVMAQTQFETLETMSEIEKSQRLNAAVSGFIRTAAEKQPELFRS